MRRLRDMVRNGVDEPPRIIGGVGQRTPRERPVTSPAALIDRLKWELRITGNDLLGAHVNRENSYLLEIEICIGGAPYRLQFDEVNARAALPMFEDVVTFVMAMLGAWEPSADDHQKAAFTSVVVGGVYSGDPSAHVYGEGGGIAVPAPPSFLAVSYGGERIEFQRGGAARPAVKTRPR